MAVDGKLWCVSSLLGSFSGGGSAVLSGQACVTRHPRGMPLLDEKRLVRQDSEDEAEQALVQAQAQVRLPSSTRVSTRLRVLPPPSFCLRACIPCVKFVTIRGEWVPETLNSTLLHSLVTCRGRARQALMDALADMVAHGGVERARRLASPEAALRVTRAAGGAGWRVSGRFPADAGGSSSGARPGESGRLTRPPAPPTAVQWQRHYLREQTKHRLAGKPALGLRGCVGMATSSS